jgi:hypothetical protein
MAGCSSATTPSSRREPRDTQNEGSPVERGPSPPQPPGRQHHRPSLRDQRREQRVVLLRVAPGASFECRIDDDRSPPATAPATAGRPRGPAPRRAPLFGAAQDGTTGLPASWAFRLDRTAPKVVVHRPSGDFVEGGPEPRVHFEVDRSRRHLPVQPRRRPLSRVLVGQPAGGPDGGHHTLRVVGTDEAGNRSDAADEDARSR